MRCPRQYPMVHHHYNQWPSYVTCFFTFLCNIILKWILTMYWALQKHLSGFPTKICVHFQSIWIFLCNHITCWICSLSFCVILVLSMFLSSACNLTFYNVLFPNTRDLHYPPWSDRSSVQQYSRPSVICASQKNDCGNPDTSHCRTLFDHPDNFQPKKNPIISINANIYVHVLFNH